MDRIPTAASLLGMVCVLLGTSSTAVAGDGLGLLRSAVRTAEVVAGDESDSHDDDHGHGGHSHSSCDDDFGLSACCSYIGFYTVTSPWWLPATMIGDDYGETGYFARHPYARCEDGSNYHGYMLMGLDESTAGYSWAGRVSGYYGDDFDQLSTIGGQVLLESSARLGIDSTADFRHQNLGGGRSDELWTGDFNVVYRFAQSEWVQMRSGVGFNYLSDNLGSDFGFNFTYGGDIMLGDPWILSAELDLGALGESSVTHFRSTLGAVFHGVEVFGGYDYYEVGDADISSLISGVRIWF